MKKETVIIKRREIQIISFAMTALMFLAAFVPMLRASGAESGVKKTQITHDIAIVFDNSGSMYDGTDRWSQSLYAIGVFASMLDYDAGDKLGIYPMGEISVGKNGTPSADRLEITKDNIKDISKIFCKETSPTILQPAYKAKEYLKSSDANEKWMIVMTDGEFYYDKSTSEKRGKPKTADWLNQKLLDFTSNDINVQYLGFAEASALTSNPDKNFYASNVSSADLLAGELVQICNKIFQRDKIDNISGGEFTIDVSMNSIVAFAQGKGAEIKSLTTSDGKTVETVIDENVKPGTEGTGDKDYSQPVADVSGQVVTFSSCEAGTYKLNYTGSDVEVFYEPNVRVETLLTDASGNKIDGSESITPGEYTVSFKLEDAITGRDVSQSPLVAPVVLKGILKNGDKEQEVASGQKISLNADEESSIKVTASYLNRYEITNESEAFGGGFVVDYPEKKSLKIDLDTNQGGNWFKTGNHESWEPIIAKITYDGKPLTDDQLKNITFKLDPESTEDFTYTCTPMPGKSAFEIKPGIDKDGKYVEPKCQVLKLKASASMKDEYGREIKGSDDLKIEIQWYSRFWRWLFWILLIAGLILLIILILNLPAWPRRMRFVVSRPREDEGQKATIRIRSSGMKIVPYEDALTCSAQKNSKVRHKLFSPRSMSILAKDFSSDEIRSFSIGAHTYTQHADFKIPGIDNEIIVDGTEIDIVFENGTKAKGHIEIY